MKYSKLLQNFENLKYLTDQSKYHPESDVLNHSLQTFTLARKESDSKELWLAAAFHDIGKQVDTLGHDQYSIDILKSFGYYNQQVFWLIENHIRVISWLDRSMKRFKKSQELLHNPWFLNLVHLRRLDTGGRNPNISMKLTKNNKILLGILLEETHEQQT